MTTEAKSLQNSNHETKESTFSLKTIKVLNYLLFASFWLIVFPLMHFLTIVKDSYSQLMNNYICYTFATIITTSSLLYLCKNLVIYSNTFIKFGLIGVGLLVFSCMINYSSIAFFPNEILPLIVIIVMVFSLQQVNYTLKDRLSYLFIMFNGIAITSLMIVFANEFNSLVRLTQFDQIIPFIGIILGMYLLVFQISIFKVLLIILAEIILILFSLQNIHCDSILTVSIPIIGLYCTLFIENKRLGLSFISVSALVLFIAHFLDFYTFFDIENEYTQLIAEISSSFKTAINNILHGTGFGTFSLSHLEQNPNFYLEQSPSAIFRITTESGILGLLAWFIVMNGLANLVNHSSNIKRTYKVANLFLILPFFAFMIIGHYINQSSVGFIILTYIIWHVGCFNNEKSSNTSVIALSKKGLSVISVSIFGILIITYLVTSIISVKQMNDIEANHSCENLSGQIINPLAVSFKKTQF